MADSEAVATTPGKVARWTDTTTQATHAIFKSQVNDWSRRRKSRVQLVDLSDEEKQELWACFDALDLRGTGKIDHTSLQRAADLVLGPGKCNPTRLRAAMKQMVLSPDGSMTWPEFRAYMAANWNANRGADDVLRSNVAGGQEEDMITIDGQMRVIDLIRAFMRRRKLDDWFKVETDKRKPTGGGHGAFSKPSIDATDEAHMDAILAGGNDKDGRGVTKLPQLLRGPKNGRDGREASLTYGGGMASGGSVTGLSFLGGVGGGAGMGSGGSVTGLSFLGGAASGGSVTGRKFQTHPGDGPQDNSGDNDASHCGGGNNSGSAAVPDPQAFSPVAAPQPQVPRGKARRQSVLLTQLAQDASALSSTSLFSADDVKDVLGGATAISFSAPSVASMMERERGGAPASVRGARTYNGGPLGRREDLDAVMAAETSVSSFTRRGRMMVAVSSPVVMPPGLSMANSSQAGGGADARDARDGLLPPIINNNRGGDVAEDHMYRARTAVPTVDSGGQMAEYDLPVVAFRSYDGGGGGTDVGATRRANGNGGFTIGGFFKKFTGR